MTKEFEEVKPHNICGTFTEKEIIWNILKLEPGHTILIESKDNNEYTIDKSTGEKYAKHIKSKTYFWRPLDE